MEVDEHHHQYNATASSSNLKRTANSSDSDDQTHPFNNNIGLPVGGKKPPGKPRAKRRAVRDADEMKNAVKTEKSCLRCKLRKVRCDRTFPVCTHCYGRNEDCDLHLWPPKTKNDEVSGAEKLRISLLEQRLAHLEGKLQQKSADEEHIPATFALPPTSMPAPILPSDSFDFYANLETATDASSTDNSSQGIMVPNIGASSLDWRLATPQMATSLSQHLCNAFFDSCCSLLPTFNYFSTRSDKYRGDLSGLNNPAKVAVAAFCAIGARPSVHSALLGIDSFSSTQGSQSSALYISAGTRRQNACDALTREAHTLGFEYGLLEDATEENLAAILALIQLMMFMELEPRRSRSLIRAAVGHFKDLYDAASSTEERLELKRTFAFAIYYADSLTSAWARKACLIAARDLELYFHDIGIIVPNLPTDNLIPVLNALLDGAKTSSVTLKTAVHLVMCWTARCQRMFTEFASVGGISAEALMNAVSKLWTSIDQTRTAIQNLQAKVWTLPPLSPQIHNHSHSASSSAPHSHDTDFVAQAIRSDRDLLDLITMVHLLLRRKKEEGLRVEERFLVEANKRVRKGLKVLAFYAKLYVSGVDKHMIYHCVHALELDKDWTKMALQRFGDPDGPTTKEEELSDVELNWFREGLHSACFFTPFPEQRLSELRSHFEALDAHYAPPPGPPRGSNNLSVIIPETDPTFFDEFNFETETAPLRRTTSDEFNSLFPGHGLSREWDGVNNSIGLEFV